MFSGHTDSHIAASMDPNHEDRLRIHIGSLHMTMTLEQFDDLVKAVYIAVNIDSAIKSATPA